MKKIIYLLVIALLTTIPASVFAQGSQAGPSIQQQDRDRVQDPATHSGEAVTPQGNQVENQNQIKTQNQGEEQQLMVATQQMQMLMSMEGLEEGIGNQVKTIAQAQVQAQNQIQTQLTKLENKSKFMKMLFGPNYGAIKNLNQQLEQNELRIEQLQQLQNQIANESEGSQLQTAIQALVDQNMSLQEQIRSEEKVGSLFGWLVKLFYR